MGERDLADREGAAREAQVGLLERGGAGARAGGADRACEGRCAVLVWVAYVSPCPCTLCVDRRVCVGLVCATRLFLSPIGSKRPTALSRRVEIPVSMTRLSQ